MKLISTLVAVVAIFSSSAMACPEIDGYPDYNCDGSLKIVVLGDSLVAGVGDTTNQGSGGYVLRASNKLPQISISAYGVKGQRTFELVSKLNRVLKRSGSGEYRGDILSADVVVLDLGRNDRWLFGAPKTAYTNLKKAAALIRSRSLSIQGYAPLVVTANLMLPNRGSQGPWVAELNKIILKSNTLKAPADLRFDLVSKRLLSTDQIHPTSKGYSALSAVFVKYVSRKVPAKIRKLNSTT